jgi:hypothetical protein
MFRASVHQSGERRCGTCGCMCDLREAGSDHVVWACTNLGCGSIWPVKRKELGSLARYAESWDRSARKLRRRMVRGR